MKPYIARYRRTFIVGGIWIVCTASIGQVIPWLLGAAVDALRDPERHSWLGPFCVAIVGAALVQGLFRYLMRRDIIGASRHIEYDLREALFSHLLRLAPAWYDRSRTGDIMTRASSDLEAVRQVVGPAFMYSSNTALIVTSSFVLMWLIDSKLTLFALLPMAGLSFVVRYLGRIVHARTLRAQEQESRVAARVQETLAGMRVVQSYAQEDHELDAFQGEARELVQRNMHLVRAWGLFFPAMALIVGLGAILTLWIGGQQVVAGAMTLGDFVAFNAYLMRLTWPMISIGWVLNLLERGAASLTRINAILHTQPEIASAPAANGRDALRGEIEFRDVSFAYDGGPTVLEGIDLHVRAGETVALVGPTGSGKSTFLALVARLYDVSRGAVRVDGRDVREMPLELLRGGIGMVPQETFLFSDTLATNIGFGELGGAHESAGEARSGADGSAPDLQGRIEAAAEVAQLMEAVRRFPRGFDTVLGERGITLSGGQKQRTAIARAVLRDPAILLLDDCLSSVDTYTEEEILKRLREIMRQRTTLIVAHRLSTVRSADRVVVLEAGRIVEIGTHEELWANGRSYADLVQKQMLREELESDLLEENP